MTKQEAKHLLNALTPAQKARLVEQIQLHKGLACLGAARVKDDALLRYVEGAVKNEPQVGGIHFSFRHKAR